MRAGGSPPDEVARPHQLSSEDGAMEVVMPKPMTPSERVLGMALANAVRPRWEPDHAAARIAEVASPLAIRHALARLRRTLHSRPSAAGLRAEEVLCLALELQDGAMPATAS